MKPVLTAEAQWGDRQPGSVGMSGSSSVKQRAAGAIEMKTYYGDRVGAKLAGVLCFGAKASTQEGQLEEINTDRDFREERNKSGDRVC